MRTTQDHYNEHLGPIYEWMAGDFETAAANMDDYFDTVGLKSASGFAVDLGCGHGIQSVALARRGWHVMAVDNCQLLLDSLEQRRESLAVTTVNDDLLNFARHVPRDADAIVCMGDTITHLASVEDVITLVNSVAQCLASGGVFCVSFRDYSGVPPDGPSRFVPVRSDDKRIHTCFLEYSSGKVLVHDLVYDRLDDGWAFSASAYNKIRLDPETLVATCDTSGLRLVGRKIVRGMHFQAFRK